MDEKYSMNTELDPEVVKVRDKIISKIGNKPLDEVNSIIKKLLNDQTDEVTRLGLLAARVKIIRAKIESLYERKVEIKPKVISETSEKAPVQDQKEEKDIDKDEKWIRVVMLQSGDVNGKQIDKGVVLDVKEEDGLKLIEAKKAEIVVEKKPEVKEEKEEKEDLKLKKDTKEEEKPAEDKKDEIKPEKEEVKAEKEEKVDEKDKEKLVVKKDDEENISQSKAEVEKTETSAEDKTTTPKPDEIVKNEDEAENNLEENKKGEEDDGSKDLLERHQERVEEVNEEKSPDTDEKDSNTKSKDDDFSENKKMKVNLKQKRFRPLLIPIKMNPKVI